MKVLIVYSYDYKYIGCSKNKLILAILGVRNE
jgi:hypothetical protein